MPYSRSTRLSADTEFSVSRDLELVWQDMTEACSLKMREVLKYCSRGESVLWQTRLDGDAFWRRSGQIIPFLFLEVEVSPERTQVSKGCTVTHTRRFGKELDERGKVRRLISQGETVIMGMDDADELHEVARLENYGVFVRRTNDPKKRRVKRLHPCLGLKPVPKRVMVVPTVEDLRDPPAGWGVAPMAGRFGLVRDTDPQIWTFSDTDGNHHVHSMSYVQRTEDFAMNALGQREIKIDRYFPHIARVLFRKPFDNGQTYWREGRFYRAPARDAYLFVGAFYPDPPDQRETQRPSVLVQLEVGRRPDRPPSDASLEDS